MNNIITKEICDGVNFTYIPSNKFKTTVVSFSAFSNLNKEDISKNSIIPCLLTNSCKKYPTFLKISTKLEELYGSSVSKNSFIVFYSLFSAAKRLQKYCFFLIYANLCIFLHKKAEYMAYAQCT